MILNVNERNYEEIKKQLFIKVSSIGKVLHSQMDIPYEERANLAITAHVLLAKNKNYAASALVKNSMLANWGIAKDQLFKDAAENSSVLFPVQIHDMNDLMSQMCIDLIMNGENAGMTEAEIHQMINDLQEPRTNYPMLVITNESRIQGAAAFFYPGVMDQVGEKMGGSYYMLPSSIHEIIVIPDNGYTNCWELETMVSEVNKNQVDPKERLTNNAYHYDTKEKVFELAESYEKRMKNQKLYMSDRKKPDNQETKKHKGPSI